eukprot:CAMPEP_0196640562 /NCGR_PEP_ID=MMETSP1085-20130531/2777_1 /TAXON_ID=41879 ORGANISM="Pycnococcus sp, Strain CCMP1998" /NCGR_SAMPLE_ID=MMETSP1085 /ASSEMBLY_ACC=CAM_ASM_000807 /LENGTH=510 /DNA_ID=CAMNT_0041969737 /DNA_START=289 /DNA_END=1818 /DNA_ORIENTATION=+
MKKTDLFHSNFFLFFFFPRSLPLSLSSSHGSKPIQRLLEVRPKVLKVLDPAGVPDERVLDPDLRPRLRGLVPVRHHRGLLDQGLHPAQRGRDVGQPDAVDDLGRLPKVPVDLEAHNASVAPHLVLGVLVVRVGGQPGVVDHLDPRVVLERKGHPHGGLVLTGDPQLQRLHPPEQEVAGVRVHHPSQDVLHVLHLAHQLLAARDVAAQHVVVSGHVLRPGGDHKIRAELQRLLVHRSRESPVHDANRAVLPAQPAHGGHVDAAQVGVGGGLRKVQSDVVLLERPLEALEVARIQHRGGDVHLVRQEGLDELPRPPVAVRRGDDMAVLWNEGQEHRRRRVHAAARHQALLRLLELRDLLLAHAHGRVAVPTVLVALVTPLLILNKLFCVLEPVRRGLHNRSRQRVLDPWSPLTLALVNAVRAAAREQLLRPSRTKRAVAGTGAALVDPRRGVQARGPGAFSLSARRANEDAPGPVALVEHVGVLVSPPAFLTRHIFAPSCAMLASLGFALAG